MPKGYPKSRFDIIDQTQIQEITTEVAPNPTAVVMATYTSNKGSEDWELLYGLTSFTDAKGGISFQKHGQAQLLVAEVLRNGGYVFGKRLVSSDATLANATVKARVVTSADEKTAYLYLYAVSEQHAGNFDVACEFGYSDFDPADTSSFDYPLFTIAAMGRGTSNISFRIVPEYSTSKTASAIKYSFEVWENSVLLESIIFTMNPDIVIDNMAQGIQTKITANSRQVKCKPYEDGMFALVKKLAQTATYPVETYERGQRVITHYPADLQTVVSADFINGMDKRGVNAFGGIVTKGDNSSEWYGNIPNDISDLIIDTNAYPGIQLKNGSNGTLGDSPMSNQTEINKLQLGAWGANKDSEQYDPVIYDVDAYKPDAVFDCNFSVDVKNAIIDVCDIRGDMVFLADLGTTAVNLDEIITASLDIVPSRYCAMYHNFFKIADPYTKKEITVTMPFLLAKKFVKHVSNGVGRPFAGLANNIYFPEIIKGTINYLPVNIPGDDQKQKLVDAAINYISYYDGTPIMETMYTNNDEYTQLSYLHNILAIQEVIKVIRSRCPRTRYTFLDGDDLEEYLTDAENIIRQYSTNFRKIEIQYMADEKYEANNIFYATIVVQFRNFIQEEYFKIIAIS